jgi:hypothetical protein
MIRDFQKEEQVKAHADEWLIDHFGEDGGAWIYVKHGIECIDCGALPPKKPKPEDKVATRRYKAYLLAKKNCPADKKKLMEDEWRDSAQELIDTMKNEFGVEYELYSVHTEGFRLWTKEEE